MEATQATSSSATSAPSTEAVVTGFQLFCCRVCMQSGGASTSIVITSPTPQDAGHRLLSAYSRLSAAAKGKFEEEARRLSVAISLMAEVEVLAQRVAIVRSGRVKRGKGAVAVALAAAVKATTTTADEEYEDEGKTGKEQACEYEGLS